MKVAFYMRVGTMEQLDADVHKGEVNQRPVQKKSTSSRQK